MSFLLNYFNLHKGEGEVQVTCPFPHHTQSGFSYIESNPSATVNTDEELFYCHACGQGYNNIQFLQKILGSDEIQAYKLSKHFQAEESLADYEKETDIDESSLNTIYNFGISEETRQLLHLKTFPNHPESIMFPVFMYDQLVDIRTYTPSGVPKIKSRKGSHNGLVLPFDQWEKGRVTLICEGEKDMAVARTKGFNAITITGGATALPLFTEPFRDTHIVIVYDNDEAGLHGANNLAEYLYPYASSIKVCTKFHEGMQAKEDITDYFTKYNHTKEDLINCIKETPLFKPTPKTETVPFKPLIEATHPENINRIFRANIQVVAVSENAYYCPKAITMTKTQATEDDNMLVGETKTWQLKEENAEDLLHLIDNNFTEAKIQENIRNLMHILKKERYVKQKVLSKCTVFKAYVTDLYETNDLTDTHPVELLAYSLNHKLDSGKKYQVTYKIVPHPYKGNQLLMIILNTSQAEDSISNFELTEETKENLNLFKKPKDLTISEHIRNLTERLKSFLGYDGNNKLIETIDLAYHTPLQFNFKSFKNERGYLDTLIIGESRIGKSSTANTLLNLYKLGTFTSLAGNSATIPGLIGGSNKTASGYQTRAGVIPQNHKGLLIFEEFGKSNNSILKELTDIRSSNEVRITRVSGTLTMPALVRMISLTNPKVQEGHIKSIASYPNGIALITELVDTAEDIARYDIILVLADKGNLEYNPDWAPLPPFPEKAYRDRIRWVWSRKAEDITFEDENYLLKKVAKLNKTYNSHIKIFGTEAWKKIARIAIAVASYTISTDSEFKKIIVTNECVDYAIEYMTALYDNSTFKYREYVEYEKKYNETNEEAVNFLQAVYDKYPMLVIQLEQNASITKNILAGATGLDVQSLNKALNALTKGLFIKFTNFAIIPTERFRKSLRFLKKESYTQSLGECFVEI